MRSLTCLSEGVDDDNNIDDRNYDENYDENENEKSESSWDANIDYDKEWPGSNGGGGGDSTSSTSNSIPDPGTSWDALPSLLNSDILGNDATELLGIDL